MYAGNLAGTQVRGTELPPIRQLLLTCKAMSSFVLLECSLRLRIYVISPLVKLLAIRSFYKKKIEEILCAKIVALVSSKYPKVVSSNYFLSSESWGPLDLIFSGHAVSPTPTAVDTVSSIRVPDFQMEEFWSSKFELALGSFELRRVYLFTV